MFWWGTRDILSMKFDYFQEEIYATACIIGGMVYFGLQYLSVPDGQLTLYVASTVVVIRLLSVFDLPYLTFSETKLINSRHLLYINQMDGPSASVSNSIFHRIRPSTTLPDSIAII